MNVQKLNEILRVFEIIRQDFSSNTKRKNLFLCTCIVLDPDINLKEMDQKFPFGGLIGYGNSSLPSSCFLGHVTGLFFCLYVKIFASSVYALFVC